MCFNNIRAAHRQTFLSKSRATHRQLSAYTHWITHRQASLYSLWATHRQIFIQYISGHSPPDVSLYIARHSPPDVCQQAPILRLPRQMSRYIHKSPTVRCFCIPPKSLTARCCAVNVCTPMLALRASCADRRFEPGSSSAGWNPKWSPTLKPETNSN
jgi:hypothetical protein